METLDVTCPDCGATPSVECRVTDWGSLKRSKVHQARAERAADWRLMARYSEGLGLGDEDSPYPDLGEVEHLVRFGDDEERMIAPKILVLAERLGYHEPGDEEAA